ncbi:DUF1918 domain-containing protein [Salmonella enterica]|uniref:Uncharacterized protein n=1 Tax=Salmonella phage vB_SenTO17 TaxID=2732254 RepID=A0A7G3SZN6_9CAUD|nr:DUF1918 domain-containing protein [Salmonella enterica]YP_010582326.1 hypothetical protein PF621_gp28 [Salmonella phage vB_SenTO17]ECC0132076.1 DUF1918 domain-containing protein [Salmonella enterica subsp. enterica serovar Stourbridge]EIT9325353.1 DUF1918 domain-containing protein [Salmonella enterica subsp. enterica serovar Agama]QJQ80411.1 hypothetical protein vBSenTO17_28 [Salmonella phage vB_SenTO17]
MFTLKDIVTRTHPHSGKTHTGVIVEVHQLNGSERYVVRVWRQFARRPCLYRPNPMWLKKLR